MGSWGVDGEFGSSGGGTWRAGWILGSVGLEKGGEVELIPPELPNSPAPPELPGFSPILGGGGVGGQKLTPLSAVLSDFACLLQLKMSSSSTFSSASLPPAIMPDLIAILSEPDPNIRNARAKELLVAAGVCDKKAVVNLKIDVETRCLSRLPDTLKKPRK